MVRVLVLAAAFLLSAASSIAYADVTEIEASVDKNPVIANESFILTVLFNDDVSNSAFQPQQFLDDFIVGRTSVSRQTSVNNGELSKLTQFSTVLIAKQAGEYQIPAIMMDGVKSQPITITVLAPGSDVADRNDQIAFIETTIDNKQVYLQQPITYITRLYLAADLNKGNLMPPKMANADVRQIGKDEESTQMIDGRRYQVYQRTFLITPNKSGDFSISGPRFDGEIYAEGTRSIFSSFSNTRPVSTIGEEKQVTVKPIPNNWTGSWLPSDLVTISQSVSTEEQSQRLQAKVGEPITVTLQLTAVGVKPEQLPELAPNFPASARVYPDNDSTDQFVRNGVTIAQKTVSFAVVPNQPGTLRIPAVEVPWFNTKRQQRAIAKTQAIEIDVSGSPINASAQTQQQAPKSAEEEATPQADIDPEATTEGAASDMTVMANQRVIGILAVLLVLSVIGNFALLWRKRRAHQKPLDVATKPVPLTANQQWRNFQKACADNQAKQAAEFLRQWAAQHFQQRLLSLNDLARWLANGNSVDEHLLQQLNELQRVQFSADKSEWRNGKALYQSLRKALEANTSGKHRSALPKLYKA